MKTLNQKSNSDEFEEFRSFIDSVESIIQEDSTEEKIIIHHLYSLETILMYLKFAKGPKRYFFTVHEHINFCLGKIGNVQWIKHFSLLCY